MTATVAALLDRFSRLLGDAGVPFMIAGSFASTAHGMPRSTQDVDIVIDPPTLEVLEDLVRRLSPDAYYVDLDAARDAYRRHSMFNVIDLASGWKVDLIICKDRPFSREELRRREPVSIDGVSVPAATAEDTIIAKLEWSKRSGGSERQRRDVAGIVATVGTDLDIAYIERWVRELNLDAEWTIARDAPV